LFAHTKPRFFISPGVPEPDPIPDELDPIPDFRLHGRKSDRYKVYKHIKIS